MADKDKGENTSLAQPKLTENGKSETPAQARESKAPVNVPNKVQAENFWRTIVTNAGPVSSLIEIITTKLLSSKEVDTKHSLKMAYVAVFLVSFIIVVTGLLTYLDKIDGSTFTFLMGLIVGYVLTFVREAIFPAE